MVPWDSVSFKLESFSWTETPPEARDQLLLTGSSAIQHATGARAVTEQDAIVAYLCPPSADAHHRLWWKVDNELGAFDGGYDDTVADLLAEHDVDLARDGDQELLLLVPESVDVRRDGVTHDGVHIASPAAVVSYERQFRPRHFQHDIENEDSALRRFLARYDAEGLVDQHVDSR